MTEQAKSPAYRWYPRDFLADALALDDGEELLYRRLLDHQWLHGDVPKAFTQMAKVARMTTARVKQYWPGIAHHFPITGPEGGWQNRRLERERSKQKAFRDKQAENGAKGGRPNLKLEGAA